ncbi:MAG: hypothetical protein ACRELF_29030, partial [Gemmataceae bacterium]
PLRRPLMSFMSRLLSGLLLFAALLASLVSTTIEYLPDWCAPKDSFGRRISLSAEQRRRDQLDHAMQAMRAREDDKRVVAEELINGEMSLFEAAAWFRLIHETPPAWSDPCHPCPRHDDGEHWCRLVIDYTDIKVRYEKSPSQADTLSHQWEAALRKQRERHGAVNLPG